MAVSSSLKLTSREAAAISSYRKGQKHQMISYQDSLYQSRFVILKVFKPKIKSLSYNTNQYVSSKALESNDAPSGVWNIAPDPSSSLVGLALGIPPGRGEAGAWAVPRAAGPIDWRVWALPFSCGPGEGEGLVDGGRRLIVLLNRPPGRWGWTTNKTPMRL